MTSLDYFNSVSLFTGSTLVKKYDSCFVQLNNSRNLVGSFTSSCKAVLTGVDKQVNYIEFNSTLNRLMRDNIVLVDTVVFNVVLERLRTFKIDLKKQLTQCTFTIDSFIEMYNIFYTQTQLFIKLLSDYDKLDRPKVPKWLLNNTPQKLMTSIHILFYSEVVKVDYENKKVDTTTKLDSLYDLLGKVIESENTDIHTIIRVLQMYIYFNKICKQTTKVVSNKLLDIGTDQKFINSLMELLNNSINKENGDPKNVRTIIELSTYFTDRSIFNFYYDKYLEKRLTSSKVSADTEIEKFYLVNFFNTKEDSKEVQCMMYKIDDIIENKEHNFMYSNMKVKFGSEKYKNLKQPIVLDKSKIEVMTLRQSVWSDTKDTEYNNYALPTEIEPYVDILSVYYNRRYPYRNLRFNFNNSVGIISLTIKEKEYQFQVTTSQMILLFQFNDCDKLSGYSLAKNMGISLASLEPILNSLLKSKLLTRSTGSGDDPALRFYLNPEFSHKNCKVSLVNYMKIPNKKKVEEEEEEEEESKIKDDGKDNIIKSMIVHVLSNKNELGFIKTFDDVKKKLPKYIKKNFTIHDFDKLITYSVKEGTVKETVNDDDVRIFRLNSSGSDSDSSIEE